MDILKNYRERLLKAIEFLQRLEVKFVESYVSPSESRGQVCQNVVMYAKIIQNVLRGYEVVKCPDFKCMGVPMPVGTP